MVPWNFHWGLGGPAQGPSWHIAGGVWFWGTKGLFPAVTWSPVLASQVLELPRCLQAFLLCCGFPIVLPANLFLESELLLVSF